MKRYLETPEEVIRTLKEGKEIFLQEGGAGKISLINGFCVKQWQDQFNINYTINLRDKPYILEKEPLKIEVGKWYETRNHEKARCYLVDDPDCFFTVDNYTSFSTNKHGYHMEEEAHALDIIGPWGRIKNDTNVKIIEKEIGS